MKFFVARFSLATAQKQVSDEMKKTTYRPNSVLTETKLASLKHLYVVCEVRSASKAIWIEKFTSASREAKRSLVSVSSKAHMVSGCETTLALHKAQPRFSREAKGKALIGALAKLL